MASENIMMQAVEKGGNRQELHERLRQHAIAAGKQVKEEGPVSYTHLDVYKRQGTGREGINGSPSPSALTRCHLPQSGRP